MLEDVDIERAGFVNFSQKVLEILNKLGNIWGQWGQFMGQEKGFSFALHLVSCGKFHGQIRNISAT
jgi:hypothetical protein